MDYAKHITIKLFSKLLEDKLTPEENKYVKTHFARCRRCRKVAQGFTQKVLKEMGGVEGALYGYLTDPIHIEEKTSDCLTEWEMMDFIKEKQTPVGAEHIFACRYCTYLFLEILEGIAAAKEIETNEQYSRIREPFILPLITRFVQKAEEVAEIVVAKIEDRIELLKQISTNDLALERLLEGGADGKTLKGKVTIFNKIIMVYEWKKTNDKWNLELVFSGIEPLLGILVKLTSPVREVASGTTDKNGELKFEEIPNGNYFLQIFPHKEKSVEIKISLEAPEKVPDEKLESLLQLADEFVEKNELSNAVGCLERARVLFPSDMSVLTRLVILALDNGLTDDATRYLENTDPNDNMVRLLRGIVANTKRNYDEAIEYLKDFVKREQNPGKRFMGYIRMIHCYGAQNKPKEVIKTFKAATKQGIRNAYLDAFTIAILKKLIGKASEHLLLDITNSLNKENLEALAEVFQAWRHYDGEVNLIRAKIATLEKDKLLGR